MDTSFSLKCSIKRGFFRNQFPKTILLLSCQNIVIIQYMLCCGNNVQSCQVPDPSPSVHLRYLYHFSDASGMPADGFSGVTVYTMFFSPIKSLVDGTMTVGDYEEPVKSNSAMMSDSILE